MPKPPDYLQWLAQLFDEQIQRLHESKSLEERTQLLRRMKILIDKIDGAILSALQDKPATKSSSPPDQPTAEF
jgi:hypothetical protein